MNPMRSFRLNNKCLYLSTLLLYACVSCSKPESNQQKLLCLDAAVFIELPASWVRTTDIKNQNADPNICTYFFGKKLVRGMFLSIQAYQNQVSVLSLENEIANAKAKNKSASITSSRIAPNGKTITLDYIGDFYGKKTITLNQ